MSRAHYQKFYTVEQYLDLQTLVHKCMRKYPLKFECDVVLHNNMETFHFSIFVRKFDYSIMKIWMPSTFKEAKDILSDILNECYLIEPETNIFDKFENKLTAIPLIK